MNKNETQTITLSAMALFAGDVLVGSGFVVTHDAWSGVRTPKGKVNVEGHYPNGTPSLRHWNRSTKVTVERKV